MDVEKRHGWRFGSDSELVWNDKHRTAGPIIVNEDGDLNKYIAEAKEGWEKGKNSLWRRLGPLEYDGMEIKYHTRIYHKGREEWLRAVEITVDDVDVDPIVRFRIGGTAAFPVEYIAYPGSMLADLRNEGVLKTNSEVNDELEDALGIDV